MPERSAAGDSAGTGRLCTNWKHNWSRCAVLSRVAQRGGLVWHCEVPHREAGSTTPAGLTFRPSCRRISTAGPIGSVDENDEREGFQVRICCESSHLVLREIWNLQPATYLRTIRGILHVMGQDKN